MSRLFALLASGVLVLTAPQIVSAQISNLALGQAKSRLACGAGVVVSSVFLPNGSLQVTCARNPVESSASSTATATSIAETTGLVATPAVGTVGAVTVLVVITGGGGSDTTSTTSTIPSDGGGAER